MTIPKTNLDDVVKQISGKPASAAYPSNLPLDLLKQISRDLRHCEIAMNRGEQTDAFAGPFALILHLVSSSGPQKDKPSELTFDEKTAFEWFQKFTFYVESELVGRIVGIPRDRTGEMLRQFRYDA
jgi:hypothetical protein